MIDFKPNTGANNPNQPNRHGQQGQKEARPGNSNPGQGGRTGAPGQGQGGRTGSGVDSGRHASDKSDHKSGVGAGKPGTGRH